MTTSLSITAASSITGLTAGDIDRDGDLDLVVTGALGSIGFANTVFQLADRLWDLSNPGVAITNSSMYTPALSDTDRDGDLDLWVGASSSILLFSGNGTAFEEEATPLTGLQTMTTSNGLNLVDFNRDGMLDIGGIFGSRVGTAFQKDDGTYEAMTFLQENTIDYTSIGVADFDGNGWPDLLLADAAGLALHLNDGAGALPLAPNATLALADVQALASADFDGDGDLDLVIATSTATRVATNNGAGNFTLVGPSLDSTGGVGISTADLNRDGRPDIILNRDTAAGGGIVTYLSGPLP